MPSSSEAHRAEQRRRERVCAAIVCDVLGEGARWRPRDLPGGPQGVHDFDIVFGDPNRVAALEVSAHTDEEAEAQQSALEGSAQFPSQLLRRQWLLSIPHKGLTGALKSGTLPAQVDRALVVLEHEGHHGWDEIQHWHHVYARGRRHPATRASSALYEFGVKHAYSRSPDEGEPGSFGLVVSTGFYVDPSSVNRAVEERVARKVAKLRRASVSERHLVVPIYPAAGMAYTAAYDVLGTGPPTLPEAITRVWVLAAPEYVLYAEPSREWASASFDRRAVSNPCEWQAHTRTERTASSGSSP